MMKRLTLLRSLLILFSLDMASCQTKDYKEKLESLYRHSVPLISTNELSQEKDNLVILDIRSKKEFEVSHIEGARFVDYDRFSTDDVKELSVESEIVVYCSVGYRSEKVGEKLLKSGYTNVRNLYGGIFQWKNDGYEVVDMQSKPTDSVHTYNKRWSKWLMKGVKVY